MADKTTRLPVVATRTAKVRDKRTYHFADPENARKAGSAKKTLPPSVPSSTIKIHNDAKILARTAWPDRKLHIRMVSEAIREAAKKALGL